MKIVINSVYGGFGLSKEALEYMGIDSDYRVDRTDPKLVECVEKLGKRANGDYADLKIIEIPDGIDVTIDDYDGIETVIEEGHYWC